MTPVYQTRSCAVPGDGLSFLYMKSLLVLFVAAAALPVAAFGYGGSYANLELQRGKKKDAKHAGKAVVHARSASGAIVDEEGGAAPAVHAGGASITGQTGTTASAAAVGTTGGSSLSSFGAGSLGC